MSAAMSVFEQFDVNCDINSQASRWEDYIDRYEDYCLAFDVTDAKRKEHCCCIVQVLMLRGYIKH